MLDQANPVYLKLLTETATRILNQATADAVDGDDGTSIAQIMVLVMRARWRAIYDHNLPWRCIPTEIRLQSATLARYALGLVWRPHMQTVLQYLRRV